MRFERLDLNLLVALEALLSERSVARAADRICLSPSATSSVLGRLRDYFEDDLLVLKGRHMMLTHRGEELIDPVRTVLNMIKSTIATKPNFVPEMCERNITIMASDYVGEVILSSAIQHFSQIAPRMKFSIQTINDRPLQVLEQGNIDLLVTLDSSLSPDHPSRMLFRDDYVVAGWVNNPYLTESFSEEVYYSLGHVTTQFGISRMPSFEESILRHRAHRRRVEVIAPSFLSVPFMILGSNRITTIYRRLAEDMASLMPLKIVPVPFDMPSVNVSAQWHTSNAQDPALLWIVNELEMTRATSGDLFIPEAPHVPTNRPNLTASQLN